MKAIDILKKDKEVLCWAIGYNHSNNAKVEEFLKKSKNIDEAIEELEALQNRSCANCKRVNKCKLANDVRDKFGTKLKEQCFYCWESK